MKKFRISQIVLLCCLLASALGALAGCTDKDAEDRAAKMSNTVMSQRAGMHSPATAIQGRGAAQGK
jgi:hypothetical protein